MKWVILVLTTSIIVILFTVFLPSSGTISNNKQKGKPVMTIASSAFKHNQKMPSKYTCDGANVNPPLTFSDIPKNAQSLVLLVDDPDAPNGTWHHWSIYNMPSSKTEIGEDTEDIPGSEGVTSFGKPGYGGPCPPSGSHRYIFTLFALDMKLDLPDQATFNEIQNAMENHVITKAELIGTYSRSN